MRTLHLLTFPLFVFLSAALIAIAYPEPQQSVNRADHNRQGLQYYDEAFYKQLPQGKQREADEFFKLAMMEFQQAIAANPEDASAYRNLARLHYVRKDFLQAAGAYRTVTTLEPQDIDAFVLLALSYTRIDRFVEAIQALEAAKNHTEDPEVIGKLDGYIRKINDHNQE
jgi:tetratricopeptide (TPR) repeat protein